MQTYQRVCAVVGRVAGFDPATIGPAQCLGPTQTPNFYDRQGAAKPLELDSLDRVALAMELEDEFRIQITDDEVDSPQIDHVGGLVAFVQGKIDAQPKTYGDLLKLITLAPKRFA
jgi:acyl carrier protein